MSDPTGEYHARVQALRAFDARCWLGDIAAPSIPGEPRARSADDLTRLLDQTGIERAVVVHTLALHGDPTRGNELLLREVAGRARLVPGAALLPGQIGPDALHDLIQRGVRMASVYPARHGFRLDAWCCGELLAALETHRLPVVIPHTEAPWSAIRGLCLDHPDLPVLVEGGQTKLIYENRVFYPLLRECPNLHLLLHALIGWRMVEDLVKRFGPERLVFGSHLPLQDPNVALGILVWGELSEAAKALVAHGNLEALIAGVRP